MAPTVASSMLALPIEIRDIIWNLVFDRGQRPRRLTPPIKTGKTWTFNKRCLMCGDFRYHENPHHGVPSLRIDFDGKLALDAERWLYGLVQTIRFHDIGCFESSLASAQSWGPLRWAKVLELGHRKYCHQDAIVFSDRMLAEAEAFKEKMELMYSASDADMKWEASVEMAGLKVMSFGKEWGPWTTTTWKVILRKK